MLIVVAAALWRGWHDAPDGDAAGAAQPESAPGSIADDLQRIGASPVPRSLPRPPVDGSPPALDHARTFMDQRGGLERSADAGDVHAAVALHLGWSACESHLPVDDEARAERAAMGMDIRQQILEQQIAQLDDESREEATQMLAAVDPIGWMDALLADMRAREAFCAGSEALDQAERRTLADRWLERAALLGDVAARRVYVHAAYEDSRMWHYPSIAAEIARRKPVVLRVMAEGLAEGDAFMLGEMAIAIGEGYYASPDVERGYAYAHAFLQALADGRVQGTLDAHGMSVLRHRAPAGIEQLRQRLAPQLSPDERARAERSAALLVAQCCGGGGKP